jgi:hypothetical protein
MLRWGSPTATKHLDACLIEGVGGSVVPTPPSDDGAFAEDLLGDLGGAFVGQDTNWGVCGQNAFPLKGFHDLLGCPKPTLLGFGSGSVGKGANGDLVDGRELFWLVAFDDSDFCVQQPLHLGWVNGGVQDQHGACFPNGVPDFGVQDLDLQRSCLSPNLTDQVTSENVRYRLRPTNPSHAFIRLLEDPLADFADVAEQDQQVMGKGVPMFGLDGAEKLGNLVVAEICALLRAF